MAEVTINGYYLIGLIGYSLVMTGLFLTAFTSQIKEQAAKDRLAESMRAQVSHFSDRTCLSSLKADNLERVVERSDKDLETCHALIAQRDARIEELLGGLREIMDGYIKLSNEYAEFRVMTRQRQDPTHASYTMQAQPDQVFDSTLVSSD